MGIPIKGNLQCSALESIISHLLQEKIDQSLNKDGEKTIAPTFSWKNCGDEAKAEGGSNLRKPEDVLGEMRNLIREELSGRSKQSEEAQQIQKENAKNRHVHDSQSVGLDDTRLYEHIEKMVERMMGSRNGNIETASNTGGENKDKSEKTPKKTSGEGQTKETNDKLKVKSAMKSKTTPKSSKKTDSTKKASTLTKKQRFAVTTALDELRYSQRNEHGEMPSYTSGQVMGVEEARLRLEELEKEAAVCLPILPELLKL